MKAPMKASDIMTRDVVTIASGATVAEAIALMQARGWRSLIVDRDDEADAYGIISDSDITCKVTAIGCDPQEVRVRDVMTKPCIVVNPDLSVENVAKLFANNRLLRAPVIQGKLLGIISISDILIKSNNSDQLRYLFPSQSAPPQTNLEVALETYFEEYEELTATQSLDNLCSG